jgi:hypothetical protein
MESPGVALSIHGTVGGFPGLLSVVNSRVFGLRQNREPVLARENSHLTSEDSRTLRIPPERRTWTKK